MRRGCDQRVALHSLQLLLQGLRIPPVIRGSSVQAVRLWLRLLVVLYRNWRKQQACHWVVRVDVTRRRRPAHFCWRAGPAAPSKAEWRGHQHHRHGFVVDRLDHAIGLRREEGEEGHKVGEGQHSVLLGPAVALPFTPYAAEEEWQAVGAQEPAS